MAVESSTPPELVMWTRTRDLEDPALAHAIIAACGRRGVPTVGYHLDRWWGLDREHEIAESPFFGCEYVCTADGAHAKQWDDARVNHVWFPPAVSEFECAEGFYDPDLASDVAFVGSWKGYHAEWWPHRKRMLDHCVVWFPGMRCWPQDGQPAVRGKRLRDLYASIQVAVGDSCLVPTVTGEPMHHYWSDRIPETLGRGALLVHPAVDGLAEQGFTAEVLLTYEMDDMDGLFHAVSWPMAHSSDARIMRRKARKLVLGEHTYTVRMRRLLKLVGL